MCTRIKQLEAQLPPLAADSREDAPTCSFLGPFVRTQRLLLSDAIRERMAGHMEGKTLVSRGSDNAIHNPRRGERQRIAMSGPEFSDARQRRACGTFVACHGTAVCRKKSLTFESAVFRALTVPPPDIRTSYRRGRSPKGNERLYLLSIRTNDSDKDPLR